MCERRHSRWRRSAHRPAPAPRRGPGCLFRELFRRREFRIERRVAIKILHEEVASSPEFAERFEREARAAARVASAHVCDVLDFGDLPNGRRYLVMELLAGESLLDRLARGTMTAAELAPIALQLLDGLAKMHEAGIVHRDLKPANIFLARNRTTPDVVVKILDFGVAKIGPRTDEPSAMTATGTLIGTPRYMSPEQARGARDVDGRSDIYAASVVFYRALTGAMPHVGSNEHDLLFKIALDDSRPIREVAPHVDEAFAAIVSKGLARNRNERFASAHAYQAAIAAWGETTGDKRLRLAPAAPAAPVTVREPAGDMKPMSQHDTAVELKDSLVASAQVLPSRTVPRPRRAYRAAIGGGLAAALVASAIAARVLSPKATTNAAPLADRPSLASSEPLPPAVELPPTAVPPMIAPSHAPRAATVPTSVPKGLAPASSGAIVAATAPESPVAAPTTTAGRRKFRTNL